MNNFLKLYFWIFGIIIDTLKFVSILGALQLFFPTTFRILSGNDNEERKKNAKSLLITLFVIYIIIIVILLSVYYITK